MHSPVSHRIQALERKIEKIKHQIAALGPLRPGSLSQQFNVCGKADCRCKVTPPRKHGPYYQLSYNWQGRSSTHFVRREHLQIVQEQLRNYRRLRDLVETWATLGMELSQLQLQQERSVKPTGPARKRRAGPA